MKISEKLGIEANERRMYGEWELGPNCPEEGLKAHALLEWLQDNGDISTENVDDDQKIDVYNIIPTGEYYDTTKFEVIDAELDGREYAVGTEDEMKRSCFNYIDDMLDDVGYEGFNEKFVKRHIDERQVISVAEDFYWESIRQDPESFFDASQRNLSDSQTDEINTLKYKISKAITQIENLQKFLKNGDSPQLIEKIEYIENYIIELQGEIEEIEESPEGDFPEKLYDDKIAELVNDVERHPIGFLNDLGLDYKDYIDKRSFIDAVIEEDGYGHTLNHYDGNADEVKVQGEWFYVMRID
jgi:hypothetical protein